MNSAELAYYESGLLHGIDLGRAQVEEEIAAQWAAVRAALAQTLTRSPFAELCERRGDHARAARARQTLTARGITPATADRSVA